MKHGYRTLDRWCGNLIARCIGEGPRRSGEGARLTRSLRITHHGLHAGCSHRMTAWVQCFGTPIAPGVCIYHDTHRSRVTVPWFTALAFSAKKPKQWDHFFPCAQIWRPHTHHQHPLPKAAERDRRREESSLPGVRQFPPCRVSS
jgi:hypothetical protein